MPTARSERLGVELHFGKRAPQPIPDATPFHELRKAIARAGVTLPPIPGHFGHGGDFQGARWLMLGNGPDDSVFPGFGGCGDCAWAGPAHEEMEAAHAAGRPVPRFDGKVVVEQYSEYSGYDPQTGENDNGSAIADVIKWRQEKGLRDADGNVYKIGQSVSLTPGDLNQLWEAVLIFENVGVGIVVTQAQMDQFDAQEPWDHVPGSPEVGGHYVPEVGRANPQNTGFITWAHRWGHTRSFYERQNDESVAFIDNLRYNQVTGETAEHWSEQDLEKFAVLIARMKAGA